MIVERFMSLHYLTDKGVRVSTLAGKQLDWVYPLAIVVASYL